MVRTINFEDVKNLKIHREQYKDFGNGAMVAEMQVGSFFYFSKFIVLINSPSQFHRVL